MPNPTYHLPELEVIEDAGHFGQQPGRVSELSTALQTLDITTLNTTAGLSSMNLGQRLAYAEQLIKSGLVPKHFSSPEKALLAFEQGEVLGLRPIEALSRLYVIDGKVSMYAELMRARAIMAGLRFQNIEEAVPCAGDEAGNANDWRWTYEMLEILPDKTILRYRMSKTWSWAKTAGLTGKDPWKKYPDAMMRNRCTSDLIRGYRPDVLMGFYCLDELIDSSPSKTHAYVLDEAGNPIPA